MKLKSTHFLRLAISVIGLGVLALCLFAFPEIWQGGSMEFPAASFVFLPIMLGLYATVIPFYIALFETFKLLNYIDRDLAFTEASLKSLKKIKICAMVISVLYVGGVPLLFPIAQADDAPGLILVGTFIACIPLTVAFFANVLEKLLKEAVRLKG